MTHISNENDTLEKEHIRERRDLESLLQEADRLIGNAPFRFFTHWRRQQARQRRWKAYPLKIAVLALLKSGKSTLINSWLGDEFLPMSSLPETAHILSIQQQAHFKHAIIHDREKIYAKGVIRINRFLHTLNAQLRDAGLSFQNRELTLKVPFISLARHHSGNISVQIIDTPGLDEANTGQFQEKIASIIHSVDAVVYLFDYTKLKTLEEKRILEDLVAIRPDLLKNGCLFFVINKIDRANRNSYVYEETERYVATLLQQQFPGATITSDQILLVSAEEALLARLMLNTRASQKARRDFLQRVFGQRYEEEEISEDLLQRSAFKLLQISRIEQLEGAILTRLLAHKEAVLFTELIHDLQHSLLLFAADLRTTHEQLIKHHEKTRQKLHRLQEKSSNRDRHHSKQIIAQAQEERLIAQTKKTQDTIFSQSQHVVALEERLSQVESFLAEISFYCQDVAL
jgi:GTPase SAR1 family protein